VGFGVGIVDGDAMMMRRRRLRRSRRRRSRLVVPTRCLQRIQKGVGDVQHRSFSVFGIWLNTCYHFDVSISLCSRLIDLRRSMIPQSSTVQQVTPGFLVTAVVWKRS
jgi:hypothetical protein